MTLIPEGRMVQPWGDEPPAAPAGAPPDERLRVQAAWENWSPFRPQYSRQGEVVRAEIDLKGNVWSGVAGGATEEEAAWSALQACIESWRARVARHLPPEWPRVHRVTRPARAEDG